MFNDPPEEVGRKWCQWSEAEVYLPLFAIHPVFFFPLTSSFLLPLLPRCPALSSQNPSPINPSFSSLALLLRLVKTGITGIAKALIFDHPHDHRRARPSPSICVMAQGLPACCPHRDCWRSATLEALRDQWTRYCIVNIQSWAQHLFVNTHASVWYGNRDHWSCPKRVVTFTPPPPPFPGVWMEESYSG